MEIMKKHKIISSDPPDNFVEIEGKDEENLCKGPRSDHEIAEMVRAEMRGEAEDGDDDEDDEDTVSRKEMIDLCARLKKACIQEADAALSLELPCELRKFQAQLQHLENKGLKQTHIHNIFNTI